MTSARRKIAVVSGSRADYGLLRWTLEALASRNDAELQLVIAGSHLASSFGHTIDAITADGFTPAAEVHTVVDGDSPWAIASSLGIGTIGFANAFRRLGPDMVVVLGDRYEIFSAAQAAYVGRVPIVHVHGGEITYGSLDDGIRHAITKFASLHLVSTDEHGRRVLQLGEPAERVRTVGAPGLESLIRITPDDRASFEARIGAKLGAPAILLTYHPATAAAAEEPTAALNAVLKALSTFAGATVLATGSNADAGGRAIGEALARAQQEMGDRLTIIASLGQIGYVSALTHCDVIVGNSSSGIIEAPSAGLPTVNVGLRQDGRPRAPSVIDCAADTAAVTAAITRAISPEFREIARRKENPYAQGGLDVSARIVESLMSSELAELRRAKTFVDMSTIPAVETRIVVR